MQAGPKKRQERLISALRHLIISLPDKTAGTWKIGKTIFLICCLLFASLLCLWCHLIDTWCWNPAMSCLRKTFRHWFDSRQGYVKGCLLWTPFKLNSRNYAGIFCSSWAAAAKLSAWRWWTGEERLRCQFASEGEDHPWTETAVTVCTVYTIICSGPQPTSGADTKSEQRKLWAVSESFERVSQSEWTVRVARVQNI